MVPVAVVATNKHGRSVLILDEAQWIHYAKGPTGSPTEPQWRESGSCGRAAAIFSAARGQKEWTDGQKQKGIKVDGKGPKKQIEKDNNVGVWNYAVVSKRVLDECEPSGASPRIQTDIGKRPVHRIWNGRTVSGTIQKKLRKATD